MSLTIKDAQDIARRFIDGGEAIKTLADDYSVSEGAIKYQLNKSGVDVRAILAARHVAAETAPEAPVFNTAADEDLGIGEEDEVLAEDVSLEEGDALASLMANPALAALIDKAVSARLAQMGASTGAGGPSLTNDALGAFTATIKHLIDNQAMQQPGYIKPLPSDEIDRRLNGKVEMEALLRRYQDLGTAPLYEVGENGFFECTNAIELNEGQQLRTFLPPPEDFIPLNEPAERVHAAMMQWIGGPSPEIGERVKQAQIDAKQAPLIGSAPTPVLDPRKGGGLIEIVDRPREPTARQSAKRRSMGSIVSDPVEISQAARASGSGREPVAPQFINA